MEEVNKPRKTSGIPMTEEGVKDWQKSFLDFEESIEYLKKQKTGGKCDKSRNNNKKIKL